jgi:hypothetical protein
LFGLSITGNTVAVPEDDEWLSIRSSTVAAIIAAAVASIAGFGVGSILTPLLAVRVGTKLAVAAISVPHLIATALPFALIRGHVDKRVFLSFGITSAARRSRRCASSHAIQQRNPQLYPRRSPGIRGIHGDYRLVAGLRFEGAAAWIAGKLSCIFGGLCN